MKVLAQFPQSDCHITLFSWNGKFIVKIEQGMLEQSYKINQLDVASETEVQKLIENEAFLASVRQRFLEMDESLYQALEQL